jgi:hypothetical protein
MGKEVNRYKGLVLGTIGGAVGTLAMEYYWKAAEAITGQDPREKGGGNTGGDKSGSDKDKDRPLDDISLVGKHYKKGESSTDAMARHEYKLVTHKEPKKEAKSTLSYITHWGFGMGGAAIYGALRGPARFPDILGGLALAVGLWGLANELAVPMLGLSEGPTASPPELHAHTLGAHIAYGLTSAAVTQILDKIL